MCSYSVEDEIVEDDLVALLTATKDADPLVVVMYGLHSHKLQLSDLLRTPSTLSVDITTDPRLIGPQHRFRVTALNSYNKFLHLYAYHGDKLICRGSFTFTSPLILVDDYDWKRDFVAWLVSRIKSLVNAGRSAVGLTPLYGIPSLPDFLVITIASKLSPRDVLNLAQTCSLNQQLCSSDTAWKKFIKKADWMPNSSESSTAGSSQSTAEASTLAEPSTSVTRLPYKELYKQKTLQKQDRRKFLMGASNARRRRFLGERRRRFLDERRRLDDSDDNIEL